jgi:replicative DNA helicase
MNAEDYARTIHDLWVRRQIIAIGTAMVDLAYDSPVTASPAEQIEKAQEQLGKHQVALSDRERRSVSLRIAGAGLMAMIEADLKGECRTLASTGIKRFDQEIGGGLRPSSLTTLAARTSMGKSIVGLEAVLNSGRQGFGCIYHSLEMPKEQLMARLASSWLEHKGQRIPFARILAPKGLTVSEAQQVADAVHELSAFNIMIEDGGGRTIQESAVSSELLMNAFVRKDIQPGPIVIDHAHIVRPSRRYNREDEGLKEVADGPLALAKRLDVPVSLLAQCNRNTESRDDKRPSLADVRGAGAFEENSDAVVFLYRSAYYIERSAKFREGDIATHEEYEAAKHSLEIIVDKNRAGRSNQVVQAWVDSALNAIRNIQGRYGA